MPTKNEQRRLTRYIVDAPVEVLNQITGQVVGSVVDIHTEGLMLIGAMEVDCVYMVRLVPREKASGIGDIELGLDCLWSSQLEQGDNCWIGCRIIDASPEALDRITRLITEFGQPRSA